jgi:hypothetical protein
MNELKRILEILASNPEHQIQYLEDLGVAPLADELGLEFDDAVNLPSELPAEVGDVLSMLDNKLSTMSGGDKSHLWQTQALSSAEEWQEVRQLAMEALTLLEESSSES